MLPYFNFPFSRAEELAGDWLIATYLVSGASYETVLAKAGGFAVGQTIGTWVQVPGVSAAMIERRQGRVVSLQGVPAPEGQPDVPPRFMLRLAFPTENFGDSFTMMLTALVGNDVSTALAMRLLDIEFTPSALKAYAGPKKGISELRALADVSEQRPLVLNMIKPCAGFSPEEGAKLFYNVALGEVDLVKDDELLGSPNYSPVAARTKAYLAAAKSAAEVTGKTTVYLPNISGTPRQVRENAKAVRDAGAKACLVNFVFGGLDTLRELTDEFGDDLFIMGHYAGAAVFDHSFAGIANSVLIGILPRLAGAHATMTMLPNQSSGSAMLDFYQTVQAQTLALPGIASMVPTIGGGMTPLNQQPLQEQLGPDTILGIGGAIQGHPMGTTQGAKAAMAAVKATALGIALETAAQSCPPLAEALRIWTK